MQNENLNKEYKYVSNEYNIKNLKWYLKKKNLKRKLTDNKKILWKIDGINACNQKVI
jgi:hypothetical protein